MNRHVILTAVILSVLACCRLVPAAPPENPGEDERAIRAGIEGYVAAYNRGDAQATSEFWREEGEWTSPAGEVMKGREAIRQGLSALFAANPGARLEVADVRVRFVSADVALEEGTARVARPGQPPSESTYLAIHVKHEGAWQLDSVRETEVPPAAAPEEPLAALGWLVGEWIDASPESTVATSVTWTKNRRFLSANFRVSAPGVEDLEGTQVIGWDAAAGTIRSWVFDSDGGFGEGVWTREGNRWLVKTTMVLPNGGRASATNVYTQVDPDSYTWQSIGRQVDGHFLPNIDEVRVVRKPVEGPRRPVDAKAVDAKAVDAKAVDAKAVDAKAVDEKAVDEKAVDEKPSEEK